MKPSNESSDVLHLQGSPALECSTLLLSSAFLFCNSHNSDNFHSIEKNKISKSKLESCLSKTKSISEIEQEAFVLLLIKRRTFLWDTRYN